MCEFHEWEKSGRGWACSVCGAAQAKIRDGEMPALDLAAKFSRVKSPRGALKALVDNWACLSEPGSYEYDALREMTKRVLDG